ESGQNSNAQGSDAPWNVQWIPCAPTAWMAPRPPSWRSARALTARPKLCSDCARRSCPPRHEAQLSSTSAHAQSLRLPTEAACEGELTHNGSHPPSHGLPSARRARGPCAEGATRNVGTPLGSGYSVLVIRV